MYLTRRNGNESWMRAILVSKLVKLSTDVQNLVTNIYGMYQKPIVQQHVGHCYENAKIVASTLNTMDIPFDRLF